MEGESQSAGRPSLGQSRKRANSIQQSTLTEYMLTHQEFATNRLNGTLTLQAEALEWQLLAASLNKLGAPKSVVQWKRAWNDIKLNTRKRMQEKKNIIDVLRHTQQQFVPQLDSSAAQKLIEDGEEDPLVGVVEEYIDEDMALEDREDTDFSDAQPDEYDNNAVTKKMCKNSKQRSNGVQQRALIEYLLKHRELAVSRKSSTLSMAGYKLHWKLLAASLNKLGGAKTVAQWTRVWVDIKSHTKKELREKNNRIELLRPAQRMIIQLLDRSAAQNKAEQEQPLGVNEEYIDESITLEDKADSDIYHTFCDATFDKYDHNSEEISTKSRQRTNTIQQSALIEYMLTHRKFATNHTVLAPAKYRLQWKLLAAALNKLGVAKSVLQWKRVWADIIFRTRKDLQNKNNKVELLRPSQRQVVPLLDRSVPDKEDGEEDPLVGVDEVYIEKSMAVELAEEEEDTRYVEYENAVAKRKRRRNRKRTSSLQQSALIEYMLRHRQFATSRSMPVKSPLRHRLHWKLLAASLNKLGVAKSVAQWIRVWSDIKSDTRRNLRKQNNRIELLRPAQRQIVPLLDCSTAQNEDGDNDPLVGVHEDYVDENMAAGEERDGKLKRTKVNQMQVKKRTGKTCKIKMNPRGLSVEQCQCLVEFMESHRELVQHDRSELKTDKNRLILWRILMRKLNALGHRRTVVQWQAVWRVLKYKSKRYLSGDRDGGSGIWIPPGYITRVLKILEAEQSPDNKAQDQIEVKIERLQENEEEERSPEEEIDSFHPVPDVGQDDNEVISEDRSLPTMSWEWQPADNLEAVDLKRELNDETVEHDHDPIKPGVAPANNLQMSQFQNTILEISRKQTEILEKFTEQYKRDEEKRTALEERTMKIHERVVGLEERLLKILESNLRTASE